MTTQDREEFSVCQFFEDGTSEYVRRNVGPKEAVDAAHHYCNSVGARMGFTKRVIITDGGDCVNFEWVYGKGVTFK
jgi:cellulase/cellobiase CelA1